MKNHRIYKYITPLTICGRRIFAQLVYTSFGCSVSVRNLPSLHIHRVIFLINEIRYLHEFIAFSFQRRDERIQRLCGVLRPVVAQNDGAVAQMLVVAHGIDDGVHAVVFPVERIHILNTWI